MDRASQIWRERKEWTQVKGGVDRSWARIVNWALRKRERIPFVAGGEGTRSLRRAHRHSLESRLVGKAARSVSCLLRTETLHLSLQMPSPYELVPFIYKRIYPCPFLVLATSHSFHVLPMCWVMSSSSTSIQLPNRLLTFKGTVHKYTRFGHLIIIPSAWPQFA